MQIWTSKLYNIGRPLIIGLYRNDTLLDFTLLSGPNGVGAPQLRMRKRTDVPADAVSFDLAVYTDVDNTPAKFNAQHVWTALDFDSLEAGRYIAEVDAHYLGENITLPDDGYFEMRLLPGID